MKILTIAGSILAATALVVFISLSAGRARRERQELQSSLSTLEDAVQENTEMFAALRNLTYMLTEDLNESRDLLGLEYRTYPRLEDTANETYTGEADLVPYFKAVEMLARGFEKAENAVALRSFLLSRQVQDLLASYNLETTQIDESVYHLTSRQRLYYVLEAHSSNDTFYLSTPGGDERTFSSVGGFRELIGSTIDSVAVYHQDLGERLTLLKTLSENQNVREAAIRNGLSFSRMEENDEGFSVHLTRESEPVLTIHLSAVTLEYQVNTFSFEDFESLIIELPPLIDESDTRTFLEKRVDMAAEELLVLSRDPGFIGLLNSHSLSVSNTIRADSEYHYLDITNTEGDLVGSFAIYNYSGEVYLLDHEQVPLGSVGSLGKSLEKKN